MTEQIQNEMQPENEPIRLSDVMDRLTQLQLAVDAIPTLIEQAMDKREVMSKADIAMYVANQLTNHPTEKQIDDKIKAVVASVDETLRAGLKDITAVFETALAVLNRKQMEHEHKIDNNWQLVESQRKENDKQRDQIAKLIANQNMLIQAQERWNNAILGDGEHIGMIAKINVIEIEQQKGQRFLQEVDAKISIVNEFVRYQQRLELERDAEKKRVQARNAQIKESAYYVISRAVVAGAGTGAVSTALVGLAQMIFGGH